MDLNNIPQAAAALYNLLSALFDFIDEQVEPRNFGVITAAKTLWVADQLGMQAEFAATMSMAPEVLAAGYQDLECQYYLVPGKQGGNALHHYGFESPDVPGLTKAGFVKLQTLGLILESAPGSPTGDSQYRFLQRCISTFPLTYNDPDIGATITFPPLPSVQAVNWYTTALAKTMLGIEDPTPAAIQARVAAKRHLKSQRTAAACLDAQLQKEKLDQQLLHAAIQQSDQNIRRAAQASDWANNIGYVRKESWEQI